MIGRGFTYCVSPLYDPQQRGDGRYELAEMDAMMYKIEGGKICI